MTELTTEMLSHAQIKEDLGGPDTYVVELSDGDIELVPKSAKNTLLLKKDVIRSDTGAYAVGDVTVEIDFQQDNYTLRRDGDAVDVPSDREEHVLWSVYDDDVERVNEIFDDLHEHTVRQGLMDWFRPRFDVGIERVDNGWLVDEDVLVKWNGENRVADLDETHEVQGSDTVPTDETKPAIELNLDDDAGEDLSEAEAPHGQTIDLESVEVRFLVTVANLADDYGDYGDDLGVLIDGTSVTGYTAPTSGVYHSHDRQKHDLADLGVTDEAADRLWTERDDHAGVWEMAVREEEFRNAPFDVFENTPNDDDDQWERIHSTKRSAPIPSSFHKELQSRYE